MSEKLLKEKKELESRLAKIQEELSANERNTLKNLLTHYIESEDEEGGREIFKFLEREYDDYREGVISNSSDSMREDDVWDAATYDAKLHMRKSYGIEWDEFVNSIWKTEIAEDILKKITQ